MKNRDASTSRSDHRAVTGFAARVFTETALAAHLVGAAYYWWLSPKGFPLYQCRFWLNSVLPIAVLVAAVVALVGILQQRHRALAATLVGFASAWCAASVAGRLLFPVSLRGLWLVGLVAALITVPPITRQDDRHALRIWTNLEDLS